MTQEIREVKALIAKHERLMTIYPSASLRASLLSLQKRLKRLEHYGAGKVAALPEELFTLRAEVKALRAIRTAAIELADAVDHANYWECVEARLAAFREVVKELDPKE